ncbi:hypothetical protein Tco_0812791 [Tanacetum coccineum]
MSWFSRCSWCGGPFNSGNYQHCTNVSFGDDPVYDSNPNSYNQTPDFSNPLPYHNYETGSRSDTGAAFQAEFAKLQQNFERFMAQQSCSYCGGTFNDGNCPSCSIVGAKNEFVHNLNPFPYDNTPDFYDQPPQHHIEDYRNERIDIHYRRECEIQLDKLKDNFNRISIEIEKITKEKELRQQEQAANLCTYTAEPSRRLNYVYYDDEESTIPLNEIISQIPPSIVITLVLPTMEAEDSLIMGDENLSTIPEKKSDEFIKFSVEDLVPIPSESEDTSDNDSECDLPFCDNPVTFSNPLFDSNNDFTYSDDKSLPEKDVQEENFKIYSNPLFEFDDEYISSDVNPLFNEVLEDIENKDSYVSNLDEQALLVTHLSELNKDERHSSTLSDDTSSPLPPKELYFADLKMIKSSIDTPLDFEDDYYDSEGDIIYLESLLIKDTTHTLLPEMALWQSQREDHTSNWLRAVLISGLGQTMNGRTYRCVLCYRLGVPLFSVTKPCSACSRVFMGDIYGDHAVSCAGIAGIKHRHNLVRDTPVDICYRSGISSGKEVDIGLGGERDNSLRPADVLLYSWNVGRDVCVDLTGSSPLTHTNMVDFVPGRAVTEAAQRKRVKYEAKCTDIGYGFLPFSFSSFAELEKDTMNLLKRIRKFSMAQDIGARAAIHIFNRISFAIAKGVAAQIVSRLPSNLL